MLIRADKIAEQRLLETSAALASFMRLADVDVPDEKNRTAA
jgi:hypothetical protein